MSGILGTFGEMEQDIESLRKELHATRLRCRKLVLKLRERTSQLRHLTDLKDKQLQEVMRKLTELESRLRKEKLDISATLNKKDQVIAQQQQDIQKLRKLNKRLASGKFKNKGSFSSSQQSDVEELSDDDDNRKASAKRSRVLIDSTNSSATPMLLTIDRLLVEAANQDKENNYPTGINMESPCGPTPKILRIVKRYEDQQKGVTPITQTTWTNQSTAFQEKEEKHDSGRESDDVDEEKGVQILSDTPPPLPTVSPPMLTPQPNHLERHFEEYKLDQIPEESSTSNNEDQQQQEITKTSKYNVNYDKFLELTGLSQKSIFTPSRQFSNHRSMMKPKDIKHKHKLRSAFSNITVIEESTRDSGTVRYWTEPYL